MDEDFLRYHKLSAMIAMHVEFQILSTLNVEMVYYIVAAVDTARAMMMSHLCLVEARTDFHSHSQQYRFGQSGSGQDDVGVTLQLWQSLQIDARGEIIMYDTSQVCLVELALLPVDDYLSEGERDQWVHRFNTSRRRSVVGRGRSTLP